MKACLNLTPAIAKAISNAEVSESSRVGPTGTPGTTRRPASDTAPHSAPLSQSASGKEMSESSRVGASSARRPAPRSALLSQSATGKEVEVSDSRRVGTTRCEAPGRWGSTRRVLRGYCWKRQTPTPTATKPGPVGQGTKPKKVSCSAVASPWDSVVRHGS